jgi:hypothetical protein
MKATFCRFCGVDQKSTLHFQKGENKLQDRKFLVEISLQFTYL